MGVQALRTVVDLVAGVVMARLLTPADYGLVAMVVPITGLVALFKDLGLVAATIQKDDINEDQVSMAFWLNLVVAVGLTVVCVAIAPLVARFYSEPRTAWITMAVAGTFVLSGLASQPQALLARQMRFGTVAMIDLLTTLTRAVTGVVTAWLGWSYWSLVAMTVSAVLFNTVAVWWAEDWRPKRPRAAAGMRAIVGFGGCLTASRLCWFVSGNADKLLIGWRLGAVSLGLYNRGFQLLLTPVEQIYAPVSSVMMSALSRVANQPDRYRKAVRELSELTMLAVTPLTAILLVLAPEAVHVLLGPAWLDAVPVFRGLAMAAIGLPVNYLCGIVLQSSGRTDVLMRWAFVAMVISILSILVGLSGGVVGVAYAWAGGVLLLRTPGFYLIVSRNTAVSFADLAMPVLTYAFPFALLVGCGVLLRCWMPLPHPAMTLVAHSSILLSLYAAYLLARGRHHWLLALWRSSRVPARVVGGAADAV